MDTRKTNQSTDEPSIELAERKRAEQELIRAAAQFQGVFEQSSVGIVMVGLDSRFMRCNPAFCKFLGYAEDELIGKTIPEITHPEDVEISVQEIASIAQGKQKSSTIEKRYLRKDGTIAWGEVSICLVRDPGGKPSYFLPIIKDITERKQAESQRAAAIEALRARESYLSAIIENQPGLLWLKDREGKFLAVNTQFANSCGLDNPELLVGKTDFNVWPRDLAEGYVADDARVMQSGKPCMVEEPIFDKGDIRWFETFKAPLTDKQGKVIGTTGYSRDITERKRMQEELQKAQKLESLGVLAGGIAHDFNNLLAGIFGYIDLARGASKDAKAIGYLDTTIASINRARALTQQLLTFAKGGAPVQKITPLIPFIQETAQFALSGSNISCGFELAGSLWPCNIDKNQIGQVIDNIVINAQQAMPGGGSIEITAQNIVRGEKEHPPLPKGKYVKVSIKDSGIGIAREMMPRIFDPFYTTKTKGHGLGLATCYSIINRHGGAIDVESELGKGSTFHVYLPASMESVVASEPAVVSHTGGGTIIVMDDEEVLRNAIRKMLETMGYSVVCKNDGREVLDFFAKETKANRAVAAMILDLTVPGGCGGKETVAQIRKSNGEIPVFVASGYTDDPIMRNPAAYGFTASLCKPFTMAELSDMLNRNLKI